jgi:nitroreductase
MDVKDAIANRLSIRQYAETTIPQEHMKVLFRALQLAPSANNRQNWEFVFVGDPDLKRSLVNACFYQQFISECAYFIAAVVDPNLKWHMVDITIALTNFTLQATELGYGTCWIGAFDETKVKELLNVTKDKKIVVTMAFGLPKSQAMPRLRKSIEEFIHLNAYGHPWKPTA